MSEVKKQATVPSRLRKAPVIYMLLSGFFALVFSLVFLLVIFNNRSTVFTFEFWQLLLCALAGIGAMFLLFRAILLLPEIKPGVEAGIVLGIFVVFASLQFMLLLWMQANLDLSASLSRPFLDAQNQNLAGMLPDNYYVFHKLQIGEYTIWNIYFFFLRSFGVREFVLPARILCVLALNGAAVLLYRCIRSAFGTVRSIAGLLLALISASFWLCTANVSSEVLAMPFVAGIAFLWVTSRKSWLDGDKDACYIKLLLLSAIAAIGGMLNVGVLFVWFGIFIDALVLLSGDTRRFAFIFLSLLLTALLSVGGSWYIQRSPWMPAYEYEKYDMPSEFWELAAMDAEGQVAENTAYYLSIEGDGPNRKAIAAMLLDDYKSTLPEGEADWWWLNKISYVFGDGTYKATNGWQVSSALPGVLADILVPSGKNHLALGFVGFSIHIAVLAWAVFGSIRTFWRKNHFCTFARTGVLGYSIWLVFTASSPRSLLVVLPILFVMALDAGAPKPAERLQNNGSGAAALPRDQRERKLAAYRKKGFAKGEDSPDQKEKGKAVDLNADSEAADPITYQDNGKNLFEMMGEELLEQNPNEHPAQLQNDALNLQFAAEQEYKRDAELSAPFPVHLSSPPQYVQQAAMQNTGSGGDTTISLETEKIQETTPNYANDAATFLSLTTGETPTLLLGDEGDGCTEILDTLALEDKQYVPLRLPRAGQIVPKRTEYEAEEIVETMSGAEDTLILDVISDDVMEDYNDGIDMQGYYNQNLLEPTEKDISVQEDKEATLVLPLQDLRKALEGDILSSRKPLTQVTNLATPPENNLAPTTSANGLTAQNFAPALESLMKSKEFNANGGFEPQVLYTTPAAQYEPIDNNTYANDMLAKTPTYVPPEHAHPEVPQADFPSYSFMRQDENNWEQTPPPPMPWHEQIDAFDTQYAPLSVGGYAGEALYNPSGYAGEALYNPSGYAGEAPYDPSGYVGEAPYNPSDYAGEAPYDPSGYAGEEPYNPSGYASEAYDNIPMGTPFGSRNEAAMESPWNSSYPRSSEEIGANFSSINEAPLPFYPPSNESHMDYQSDYNSPLDFSPMEERQNRGSPFADVPYDSPYLGNAENRDYYSEEAYRSPSKFAIEPKPVRFMHAEDEPMTYSGLQVEMSNEEVNVDPRCMFTDAELED